MSKNVDTRVVEMKFDNKQFESNVSDTMSTLEKLKNRLKLTGASKGLEDIGKTARTLNFSGLNDAVETVRLKFSALQIFAVTALTNIANSAFNAGKRIVSALTIDPIKTGFAEYETQINAVQTILANTASKGTNLTQVNRALDELNLYADRTIYNFTEMTRNIGTFTAAGIDLNTSVAAIKGIANLAAVSGSTSQQASVAMYQLSQALSSGTVKLMDWNSVVNAGMGGQVFQDALKETARLHGVGIDQMIKDEGSFRETLQKGWLTSTVLTETLQKFTGDLSEEQLKQKGYTEEQVKEIVKLGEMANDAATKVKTLSQLWDTMKESAQSGWTQTWTTIIGDFEEAKELFTKISDTVGAYIGKSADARNKLLEGALSSGWKQFLKQGIADEEGYKETIINVAKERGIAIDDLIKKEGSLQKVIKSGKISSDILKESLTKLTEKTKDLSDKQLEELGYTREQVDALEDLEKSVQNGTVSFDKFYQMMLNDSGREKLISSFENIARFIGQILTPIGEAFRAIFPPMTVERLSNIIDSFHKFTEKLKLSDEVSENLRDTFKGLFSILDIIKQAFSAVFDVIKPLFNGVGTLLENILKLTGGIGRWIANLNETIRVNKTFETSIQRIIDFVKNLYTSISNFGKNIKERFNLPDFEQIKKTVSNLSIEFTKLFGKFKTKIALPALDIFLNLIEKAKLRAEQLSTGFSTLGIGVRSAFSIMGDILEKSRFFEIFSAIGRGVKKIADGIIKSLSNLIKGLADSLGSADLDSFLDILNTGAFAGIAYFFSNFFKKLTEPVEGFKDLLDGAKGILDGVKGSLEAYQTSLKANILTKIAIAIGLLAASVWVLASIDSDKLSKSLGAITVLFADLMVSLGVTNKLGSMGMAQTIKSISTMIGMAVAVLILSAALKSVANIDEEALGRSLLGLTALMGMMVVFAKAMSINKKAGKGAVQMLIFAYALKVLADVCKELSSLSWDEMGKGLAGVGGLLLEIAIFMNLIKSAKISMGTAVSIVIIAAALKLLADVVSDFAAMKWEEIGKGLAAIGGLLLEIAVFSKLTNNSSGMLSSALSLVIIAASMKIFASAMEDFAKFSWEEIGRGLAAMAGALMAVAISTKLMPKNMVTMGVGILLVSGALLVMAKSLTTFSGMSWEEIGKGLAMLGGSMLILAIGLNAMKGTLLGSAAMLVAVAALAILTPILKVLGGMSWESIAKGLITIAGAFAILGIAGLVLAPLLPVILGLSASLLLVGVAVIGIGAGLLLLGTGISAIAIGFGALATAGVAGATALVAALAIIIGGIADLIPLILVKFGEAIIAFAQVIIDGVSVIGEAIQVLLLETIEALAVLIPEIVDGVLILVDELLKSLVTYTPSIVDSIMDFLILLLDGITARLPELIESGIELIMAFFEGILVAFEKIDPDMLLRGLVGVGIMAGIMLALSAVAGLIPGALVGVLGMGLVIAELALVIAAIGLLAQIPGLDWLIGEGGKLLQTVGVAIGNFVGGIVGGIMSGISSQFPKIADDLSQFMINLQPFIEGAQSIQPSSMDGIRALADAVLVLTAANLLDGITKWITGGSSIVKFGEELAEFGPHFKKYYDSVSGIDGEVIVASSNAAKALSEMADNLPNQGGVLGWFMGENSISTFADELVLFGPKLKQYSDSVKGLDGDVVVASANAALALAEMASKLPNQGGVVGWFMGENSLSVFATELATFGPELMKYANSVVGLNADVVEASVNAALALAGMADNLPNQGGAVSWFTGDNTLSTFGAELAAFGPELKKYSDSVKGVKGDVVISSVNAAKALTELASGIQNSGGLVSLFTGDNTLDTFGKQLSKFGGYFTEYYNSISTIVPGKISSVTSEIEKLINLAKNSKGLDSSVLTSFGDALKSLGKSGVDKLIEAFDGSHSKVVDAINKMIVSMANGASEKKEYLSTMLQELVTTALSKIDSKARDFSVTGRTLIDNLISGVNAKNSNAKTAMSTITNTLLSAISSKYSSFYKSGTEIITKINDGVKAQERYSRLIFTNIINRIIQVIAEKGSELSAAGRNIVTNVSDGMSSNKYAATSSMWSVINSALNKAREFYYDFKNNVGKYLVLGFAEGITDNTWRAAAAARAMATAAINAANKALDSRSPSREMYKVGSYGGMGFVNALVDYSKLAADAGSNMAKSALTGLKGSISRISDYLDSNIDSQPVIRPVLDMSNVAKGISMLDLSFSRSQAISIGTQMNQNGKSQLSNFEQLSPRNGVNFIQNNYSPKALSRLEIYRQTRNQISAFERMVKA